MQKNAFYYSFQHEIDAFVHQFYGFLKQEKPNHLNFEQLLNYSEYINALSAYKFVYNKRNDKKVMNWINYLGYDRKSYFKRLIISGAHKGGVPIIFPFGSSLFLYFIVI